MGGAGGRAATRGGAGGRAAALGSAGGAGEEEKGGFEVGFGKFADWIQIFRTRIERIRT